MSGRKNWRDFPGNPGLSAFPQRCRSRLPQSQPLCRNTFRWRSPAYPFGFPVGCRAAGSFVCIDELSIGLHQSDNLKLIETLKNSVTEETRCWWWNMMRKPSNRRITSSMSVRLQVWMAVKSQPGCLHEIVSWKDFLTGDFLSGRERIEIPEKRRITENGNLTVRGAVSTTSRISPWRSPLACLSVLQESPI